MSSKKVLITGSSGFVGKKVTESLSTIKDIVVYQTTRIKEKSKDKILYLDLNYHKSIKKIFSIHNFKTVIHLGGYSSPLACEKSPNNSYLTNVKGTLYLADKAKKNNVDCFINFSSNKSIYPKSVYGKQKHEIEQELLKISNTNFNCISYRCGNILKSPNSFLFQWLEMHKKKLCISSSGKNVTRNFILIEDVVKDLITILLNQKKIHNCVVIPEMKTGKIYSFLKVFTEINQAKIEIIPNRKIDNLHDYFIAKNELNKILFMSINNRNYGLINELFKNDLNNDITHKLLIPLSKIEIKNIIESIN